MKVEPKGAFFFRWNLQKGNIWKNKGEKKKKRSLLLPLGWVGSTDYQHFFFIPNNFFSLIHTKIWCELFKSIAAKKKKYKDAVLSIGMNKCASFLFHQYTRGRIPSSFDLAQVGQSMVGSARKHHPTIQRAFWCEKKNKKKIYIYGEALMWAVLKKNKKWGMKFPRAASNEQKFGKS